GSMITYMLVHKPNPTSKKADSIKTQDVNTKDVSPLTSVFSAASNDKLVINGELQANQNLLLTPSSQPNSAQFGEIYIDSQTGELRFYNGKTFVTVADANALNNLQAQQ